MLIECEGEIVTNTTIALVAARKALNDYVMVKPYQLNRRHSRIYLRLDGDTELYYADVQLDQHSMPVEATGSPTVIPFMFNWICNFGYWTAYSSGLPAYI
jgi:3-dehydroquinate synthase class II